jgi:hypothetical protein
MNDRDKDMALGYITAAAFSAAAFYFIFVIGFGGS